MLEILKEKKKKFFNWNFEKVWDF